MASSSAVLPPLGSSGLLGRQPVSWKSLLTSNLPASSNFSLSYIPTTEDSVCFSDAEVDEASQEWNLSLVGYALGKRPFYGNLLQTLSKMWKLKGTVDLLSLTEGFFLFKFTCAEDVEMVLFGGPWFFNGRPFLFKRWSPEFRPVKEDFSEVPIWARFPDLPLCCWNENGISKIASKIGIPLAVDPLTSKRSRLTYARVSLQISTTSVLPESINLLIRGKTIVQPVLYEWKPTPCPLCNTFAHEPSHCPKSPSYKPPQPLLGRPRRGRSTSRGRLPPAPPLARTRSPLPPPFPPALAPSAPAVTTPPDLNITVIPSDASSASSALPPSPPHLVAAHELSEGLDSPLPPCDPLLLPLGNSLPVLSSNPLPDSVVAEVSLPSNLPVPAAATSTSKTRKGRMKGVLPTPPHNVSL